MNYRQRQFWLLQTGAWTAYGLETFLSEMGYGRPLDMWRLNAYDAVCGFLLTLGIRAVLKATWTHPPAQRVRWGIAALVVEYQGHGPDAVAPNGKRVSGKKYVLPPETGEHDDDKHTGLVIAEKPTDIDTLTVSQAVMKMDLQHLPALMFFNSAHGRLNVVYRREDGNISWVDPEAA